MRRPLSPASVPVTPIPKAALPTQSANMTLGWAISCVQVEGCEQGGNGAIHDRTWEGAERSNINIDHLSHKYWRGIKYTNKSEF